jgi:membrane-bound serine protease (ClpP class)
MKFLFAFLLQAIAFGVGFLEVIVPSFGVLTVLCAGIAIYSWVYIINELPHWAAMAFGIADLILVPLGFKFAFKYLGKSAMSHQSDLGTGSGLEEKDRDLSRHVGTTALVEAQLRPSGKIRIGEDVYEAQTHGEWVEKGREVKVVSVNGSRFNVEAA